MSSKKRTEEGAPLRLTDTSRFMSLILRHKPETIGISLDGHGWAGVDELIAGIAKTHKFNMDILEEIVRTDNKQRYSFNEDKTMIRANQGHSILVDVEPERQEPPKYLYHGTGEKHRASIDKQGLIPKSRLYVHLSSDIDAALKEVNDILLRLELDDESLEDTSRSEVIFELASKYSWEVLQQALFKVLLDDNRSEDDYYQMAEVFWIAVLEGLPHRKNEEAGLKFQEKTIIGLLYYRLRNSKEEFTFNLIWSITSKLYHLDYCNSQYDPIKDEKIINELAKYGLTIS